MTQAKIWYGYLDAGKKSAAVVRDDSLDTGNTKMIYLYNFSRKAFLQYDTGVVAPKLREFKDSETDLLDALKKDFAAARAQFQPQNERLPQSVPASKSRQRSNTALLDQENEDDTPPFLDDENDWDD